MTPMGNRGPAFVDSLPRQARFIPQAVDSAGNVAVAMGKGEYIQVNREMFYIYLPLTLRSFGGN